MDPQHQQHLQRLLEIQRLADQNQHSQPWDNTNDRGEYSTSGGTRMGDIQDAMIFPGLYAPSGFDMMSILIRVHTRPNPKINIGNIDSETAVVLCDLAVPDHPIVYCSEAFETLTGYACQEIIGKNCRFLQKRYPGLETAAGQANKDQRMCDDMNRDARKELREALAKGEEAQVSLINFKKSGERFQNILTTIPINWGGEGGKKYIVGFQADPKKLF